MSSVNALPSAKAHIDFGSIWTPIWTPGFSRPSTGAGRIGAASRGRRVLNLFGYTGAFTVYAAGGGARATTTVDLSNTYLKWAQDNLTLNGLGGPRPRAGDVSQWLQDAIDARERYDPIVSVSTFSNSKMMRGVFDVVRDHPKLIAEACPVGAGRRDALLHQRQALQAGVTQTLEYDHRGDHRADGPADCPQTPLKLVFDQEMTRTQSKKIRSDGLGLYATCDSGLEQLLADELRVYPKTSSQAIVASASSGTVWLYGGPMSSLASPIGFWSPWPSSAPGTVRACTMKRIKWHAWFAPSRTIAVDASLHESTFQHSGFAAQVVKDGICDRFRAELDRRPSVDRKRPDVRINLRVDGDACTLSIDSSGERLHRRGYRTEAGEAPLKETLAAGILSLANWREGQTLVDPMCGSGTFLIEAAMVASRTAPGS